MTSMTAAAVAEFAATRKEAKYVGTRKICCPKLKILQKLCQNFENFAKNLSSIFLLFFSIFCICC